MSRGPHPEICPHHKEHFKGIECGYKGKETRCNGTYKRCLELENATRFGGELGLSPGTDLRKEYDNTRRKRRELTAEKAIKKMLAVKDASDGKVALLSCQGQAMDGYSELANYRQILDQYRK